MPIDAPVIRNMRITAPLVAPIVRRMAMSRPLSFTSIIRPEMMFSAATSTISDRMMNITLRSTASTLKNVSLRWRQSLTVIVGPAGVLDQLVVAVDIFGIVDDDFDDVRLAVLRKIFLRLRQRHEDHHAVVLGHAEVRRSR